MPNVIDQARKTAEFSRDVATEVGNQTTRTVQGALRDGALATVGAGDQLVRRLRGLSERVRDLDLRTEEGRRELEQRMERLREQAASEFEGLVARGREVVDELSHSPAAERAADQGKVATSQLKAAVTSFRRIADRSAGQAAQAVTGLGSAADAGAEQADLAASQARAAATSVRAAGGAAADAAADASERIGAETAGTAPDAVERVSGGPVDVPLEDLTVAELREMAKERDIEGRTGMNKAELVRALRRS